LAAARDEPEPPASGAPFLVEPAAQAQLLVIAIVCLGLFLISPYSGAFWPATAGRPPRLAMDNVRYLWPAFVGAFPLGALGISRLPFPRAWAAAIAALSLALLLRLAGHLAPGIAIATVVIAVSWVIVRFGHTRARLAAVVTAGLACIALAAAVAWVDPLRERVN